MAQKTYHSIQTRFIIIAVVFYGLSCNAQQAGTEGPGSSIPSPTLSSDSEPNNSFGTATPVAANTIVSGTIYPERDQDWYGFEVHRQGRLEISFRSIPSGLSPQVLVRNGDNSTVLNWTSPRLAGGGSEVVKVPLTQPGRYYVAVADKNSKASNGQYSLKLSFYPGDDYEANNSFGTATEIHPTGTVSLSILPLRDYDWFKFEVDRRGTLDVSFHNVPNEITPAFLVRNAENSTLLNWQVTPIRNGSTEMVTVNLPTAGGYYISVAEDKSDASSPNRMLLKTPPY